MSSAMLCHSTAAAGQFPPLIRSRDHTGNPVGSYGDREGRKRWGEYKTDEPNAHGGFGRTDGFSKYRTNVNLCTPIPERVDFNAGEGFMLPPALIKYDMTKETRVPHNHCRRFKQDKVTDVFPLSDPRRNDGQGNYVLTAATREGLESNTSRFYQSTRNQRVYLDHTAEIRRRVAEKIRRKRIEELKAAIRVKAFLNPTPEIWAHYRQICSIAYDLDSSCNEENPVPDASEDTQADEEQYKAEYSLAENTALNSEEKSSNRVIDGHALSTDSRETHLLSKIDGLSKIQEISNQRETNAPALPAATLKGILKEPQHETNQFVRPWVDAKMAMQVCSWKPYNRCAQRPSRRVRFKDEGYNSFEDSPVCERIPTPIVTSVFPDYSNKNPREFEEPEALYYDPDVCTNIPSRLGLQFKSEACKRFHQRFQDPVPDLRDFRVYPKKHFFYDRFHASVFRG